MHKEDEVSHPSFASMNYFLYRSTAHQSPTIPTTYIGNTSVFHARVGINIWSLFSVLAVSIFLFILKERNDMLAIHMDLTWNMEATYDEYR